MKRAAATNPTRPIRRLPVAGHVPFIVLGAAAALLISALAPHVWLVLLTDGLLVLALLAGSAGLGAWPARWLSPEPGRPGRQFALATALGLGVLSTLTLILGVAGLLSSGLAWGLLAVGGLLGLWRLARPPAAANTPQPASSPRLFTIIGLSLALLPLCVPLAIGLFGASLPVGLLWSGEARGYDVLEYHLQTPREYFDAGRIHFLPHNVYASFPQLMETLYLLLMHLAGGTLVAAIPAQLLHLALGVLTVAAVCSFALRSPSGWLRVAAVLVAGSVPWLTILGCLAYVELGVIFFAVVAGGLVLDTFRTGSPFGWRPAISAGLCAGLAGGCKYTALVLVAVALGIAWFILVKGGFALRLRRAALYGLGVLLAFSPWLIRNVAFTGNPVYPFAYSWFGGRAWSSAQAEQWARAHALPPESASLAGRIQILVDEALTSQLFGPAMWLLPLVALVLLRRRPAAFLTIWALILLAAWATFTHMPGRFAVPVLAPLALLMGGLDSVHWSARRRRWLAIGFVSAASLGAVHGAATLVDMLRAEEGYWQSMTGYSLYDFVGASNVLRVSNPINAAITNPDARVWLVGEARVFYLTPRCHYTVAFNRDPWLSYAAAGATPEQCVAWLRTQNVTHVVFSWTEIERLRRTYGFPAIVTPDWVRQLADAGLRRVVAPGETAAPAAVEIYEVDPA